MEPAEIHGTAYDATVDIGPPVDDDPLRRLQLADLEARELVERMRAKVAKFEGHLESVRDCLAEAEEAADRAAAELREYGTE